MENDQGQHPAQPRGAGLVKTVKDVETAGIEATDVESARCGRSQLVGKNARSSDQNLGLGVPRNISSRGMRNHLPVQETVSNQDAEQWRYILTWRPNKRTMLSRVVSQGRAPSETGIAPSCSFMRR